MLPLALITLNLSALTPPVTQQSLLDELADRTAIARWPDPEYTCHQSSSYDRASISPDKGDSWFANDDFGQYGRAFTVTGREEHVMFEREGPGAVVRIWSPNPKGTMRLYIDGSTTPAVEGPMDALLGGKGPIKPPLSVEHSRGFNLLVPIPYAKKCLITTDAPGVYYQVNERTYPAGTAVESFVSLAKADAAIVETNKRMQAVVGPASLPLLVHQTLAPRQLHTHTLPAGPMLVRHLAVKVGAANLDQALRSTVLMMETDGQPTVWCPVGDLFAMGPGVRPFSTWRAGAEADGTLHLSFPMPYASQMLLAFENTGDAPVTVDASVEVVPTTIDDRTLFFHATWRDQYPIHTRPRQDWNYVSIKGRGVYAGDSLSVMNPVKAWWGEGDEKIYVDGEPFPSHFGTGTEDYYGFGWCCPIPFAGPFNAQPRCDGRDSGTNLGRTTVMRTRGLDGIPFRTSLRFDMEVWHWEECDVEYAATAYFYARPGATHNRTPDHGGAGRVLVAPPPPPPPVKIDGAIEFESLTPAARSASLQIAPQGGMGDGLWSRDQHHFAQGSRTGDFVEYSLPASGEDARRVTIYATRSWDYAIVQPFVNGAKAGDPIDLCSGEHRVKPTGALVLGDFRPVNGRFTLRFEIVGSSPKAEKPGTYFGLDCVTIR